MFTCESVFKPAAIQYVYLFMCVLNFRARINCVWYCFSFLIAFSIEFFNQASFYMNNCFSLGRKHEIK